MKQHNRLKMVRHIAVIIFQHASVSLYFPNRKKNVKKIKQKKNLQQRIKQK